MARNKVRAKDLQGFSIHHGEKQTFLLDWFDRTPRVLDDDDAKQFSLWQMKLPAAILIGCFIFSYNENIPVSFAIGVAVYVVATIVYLFSFVKKLPEAKSFQKEQKDSLPVRMSKQLSTLRLAISVAMLLALSVLLIIFGKTEGYTGFYLFFTCAISVITFVMAIISLYAIILKKKSEKK